MTTKTQGLCLVVYPAADMDAAKKLFRALLGVEPYADTPYYTGFRAGEIEIGLDPKASSSGPIAYWAVDDIKGALNRLLEAGAELVQDVRKVGPGRQIAQVKDAGGSTLGILQDS